MEKNTPIFYKKLPKTEETKPNARYIRSMGTLPKEGEIHEIEWRQEKWTVRRSEFFTPAEALAKTAKDLDRDIEVHKSAIIGPYTPLDLANRLGISLSTLRLRRKLIQNHLNANHNQPDGTGHLGIAPVKEQAVQDQTHDGQ